MFNNNTRQNSITNRSVYYVRDNKKQRVKLLETITNSNDKDLVLGLLNIWCVICTARDEYTKAANCYEI